MNLLWYVTVLELRGGCFRRNEKSFNEASIVLQGWWKSGRSSRSARIYACGWARKRTWEHLEMKRQQLGRHCALMIHALLLFWFRNPNNNNWLFTVLIRTWAQAGRLVTEERVRNTPDLTYRNMTGRTTNLMGWGGGITLTLWLNNNETVNIEWRKPKAGGLY